MSEKLKLIKPIEAHDEMLAELEFRLPTGRDIAACGYPFQIVFQTGVSVFDPEAISKYISALAGIPRPSVDRMAVLDWSRAMGVVLGFFADTETPQTS